MNGEGAIASHIRSRPARLDVFLQPGDWCSGDASYRVRTLLGSCVSVTLWNPRARVGAMSHSLLPSRGMPAPRDAALDSRYVDEALALMVDGLADLGVTAQQCEAKIFGGGDMFGTAHNSITVGQRNGEAARVLLRRRGIEVTSESLFGEGHRQMIFDIATGEVWARQIPRNAGQAAMPPEIRIGRFA